jgi:hypothetical protein
LLHALAARKARHAWNEMPHFSDGISDKLSCAVGQQQTRLDSNRRDVIVARDVTTADAMDSRETGTGDGKEGGGGRKTRKEEVAEEEEAGRRESHLDDCRQRDHSPVGSGRTKIA